jgi:pyridoxamine 5'-phosphate oxidase
MQPLDAPDARHRPTFSDLDSAIWAELSRAVGDKGHPWRVMALATVDADGEAQARHVVLREAQPALRQLMFFTDRRSPKVEQMRRHDRGTLLMWNPQRGCQLRLKVRLEIIDSGLEVSSRWARLALSPAAQDYLSPLPPGTPLAARQSLGMSPSALDDEGSMSQAEGSQAAAPALGGVAAIDRGHFAMVKAHVQTIDWLELHPLGHRRALWQQSQWKWVAP